MSESEVILIPGLGIGIAKAEHFLDAVDMGGRSLSRCYGFGRGEIDA